MSSGRLVRRRRRAGTGFCAAFFLVALTAAASAQTGSDGGALPLRVPGITVVATTPLPGIGIDADKVPGTVQTLSSADLRRSGSASIIRALQDEVSGVNISDTLGDGLQPDILYHGFEASPVLGTPEGLAVYQNGVRINEPFGDMVNWDLIPAIAIDRIDLVGANPVYGLNALGGAVAITMKDGFSYDESEAELSGGSFGQRDGAFQYGRKSGNLAAYVAGRALDADGWRRFSPDSLEQLYADLAARNDRGSLDVSFTGANNRLFGQGVAPVQELALDRALTFTGPQHTFNQLAFVTATGSYQASDALWLQGDVYRREFRQTIANGNTTGYTACSDGSGVLCQSNATTPLVDAAGNPIPDLSNGGALPLGENDTEAIRTVSLGGALQATHQASFFDRDNHLVVGASIDHSTTDFQSTTEIGVIAPSLTVLPSAFFVATPEGTGFIPTPVGLGATTDYYGVYVTDTFDATPALSITASARYNLAEIALIDRIGSQLTGDSQYRRLNPAIGATYKISPALTAYAGYAEANRAPNPSEIECSNPAQPCLLPSSLSSDPPKLKQVVAHSYETGLRGDFAFAALPGTWNWNLGLYRTDLNDDIFGVATSISSGFFENIGATRRQGVDAAVGYRDDRWSLRLGYSLVDATFQSPLLLPSPNNPAADTAGDIHAQPGDRLPGIPEHRVTLNGDHHLTQAWIVGATITYTGAQFYRGDESNQNKPLPGYALVNFHTSYEFGTHVQLFATIDNLLDARYATFGQYGDPTGGSPAGIGVSGVPAGGAVDTRFQSPGAPIAGFVGVRAAF